MFCLKKGISIVEKTFAPVIKAHPTQIANVKKCRHSYAGLIQKPSNFHQNLALAEY